MGKALKIVLLGVGNAANAVISLARMRACNEIVVTTRNSEKKEKLSRSGLKVILGDSSEKTFIHQLETESQNAHVLVSFPPDGHSDSVLSAAVKSARKIVYISTTGVFGGAKGRVDENTPVDGRDEKTLNRLQAERIWQDVGAVILRAPGLYGPATGLHLRLRSGTYRLPGHGQNHISRIHLDDLANIVLAAFEKAMPSSVYVVGDEMPVPHIEVVKFLCSRMNLPMPETMPFEEAHSTVRGDRQVVGTKVLKDLGLVLKYPSYKEGYEQCLEATAT